ncbi:MAG: hypothetical protein Q7R93_04740 [bacterium]|nr:hypothetical protein [bacterium]
MKNFSLKFLDIMIGIVLGLGFQWWPELQEPWQYIAFVFVYLDIVDYWIDYGPSLKKFPPKREIDVMLDVAIMFSLFLYIYATQLTIMYLLGSFVLFRVLDYFWLLSSKHEYHPTRTDKAFVDTWLVLNLVECLVVGGLMVLATLSAFSPLVLLSVFIIFRIVIRICASWRYRKIHFI